jgi:hypothetical protein
MKPGKMCCKTCGMSWPRSSGIHSLLEQKELESTPCPACEAMTLSYESTTNDKISGLSLVALISSVRYQAIR